MIPAHRPRQTRADTLALLKQRGVADLVCLVGVRGYYLDSMGAKGTNDVGLYDDAIILVSPNVDPSRLGYNAKAGKPMAQLRRGVYDYKLGLHGVSRRNPYRALVQAGPVTVMRGEAEETGWFGINIHRGGVNTTSSEGCQTVPPPQWPAFITLVETEMKRNNAKTIRYMLTEAA
jgi:lysozyme